MIYKLVLDLDTIDLNLFCEVMGKQNLDFCFGEEEILLHVPYNTQIQIGKIMKKMNITNYFLKEVKEKPSADANGFVFKWIWEKMGIDEAMAFESAHQTELREMMDNIQRVRELVEAQRNNQKEADDGRVERTAEAETGSPQENTCRTE